MIRLIIAKVPLLLLKLRKNLYVCCNNLFHIKMKKIILLNLLCLPFLIFAQTSKQISTNKAKALAEKAKENKPKATVVAGSQQYGLLKAQGKLANYQVIEDNNVVALKAPIKYSNTKTAVIGPCDFPPFSGTNPYLPSTSAIDDTKKTIALGFSFCFYGVNYTSLNVYDNGNVQFSTNSTNFTSTGFPSTLVNMIAPFWSDGKLNNLVSGKRYGKVLIDQAPTHIVISWDSLPYYQGTVADVSKLNRFQLVLTNGNDPILPPGKNVGFYYTKMQWTTGDASDGLNGFPDPSLPPAKPATVGANQGNGTDYFQIGRFGVPGSAYDGPQGNNDGVSWLDGKSFFFDLCPPAGANIEPVALLGTTCSTVNVCGNDTIFVKNTFVGPESNQTVTITATAASLGSSFSYSTLTNPNGGTDIYMIVDGNTAPAGYHTIIISATDNGTPALTNGQQLTVFVDQATVSGLSGNIVISPTVGACPGGVVTASIAVTSGTVSSYLWNDNSTGTAISYTTVSAADSLVFVTLTSGLCSKTIVGDINVNPVPVASITGNLSFCNGNTSSTVLSATNTLNPASQGPHTFLWSTPNGTLNSTTDSAVVVSAGIYSVTVTNQFGCISSAVTSVTANITPSYTLNSISGGSVYCVGQDSAHIAVNWGNKALSTCTLTSPSVSVPNIVAVGTGTTTNTSTSFPSLYGNYYKNVRHQMIFTAAELLAAGVTPGNISSVSFPVNSKLATNTSSTSSSTTYIGTLPNYSIKMKCTSSSVVTSTFDNSGLTQVFFGDVTPVVGINTHTLAQSYNWDGVSNLLVDVCYTRNGALSSEYFTSNPIMPFTTLGTNRCVYYNSDGTQACPITIGGTTSNNRPNIKFGSVPSVLNSNVNIIITPNAGVVIPASHDSIKIKLPTTAATQCYTVSVINTLGNCSKDTVICVQTVQGTTQGTLGISSLSVCPNETLTISALGALATHTLIYTDNVGTQTSTLSNVNITAPSSIGVYTYTLLAEGACGGALTTYTNTLTVNTGVTIANLNISKDSICPGTSIDLSASGSILPTYTISYADASGLHSVVGSSVTVTPTVSIPGQYQTYTLTAQGACGGPITNFTDSVKIYIGTTSASLTVSDGTVCPGVNVTLSATQTQLNGLASYTISYVNSVGVLTTSVNSPATFVVTGLTSPIFGTHVYTLTAQGGCSALPLTYTNSVFVEQGVSQGTLSVSSSTVCKDAPVTLSAIGNASTMSTYTIAYVDGTGSHTSTSAITFTPAISATYPAIYTYSLIVQGPCSANPAVFTNTLTVIQGSTAAIPVATPSIVCFGSPITLSATQGAFVSYTITYNNGASNITAPANTDPTFNTASVTSLNSFTVSAQGTCGAPTLPFVGTYSVQQKETITIAPMANVTKCLNATITLTANASSPSTGPYSYNWQPAAINNTASTFTTNTAITQTYVVIVTGTCAIPATASVVVDNYDINVNTTILEDTATLCANTDLVLHATTAGGLPAYAYNWSIAPNSTSLGTTNNLTTTAPATEGTYTIVVAATDACGFVDTDTQVTIVLPPCNIEIGNIFSPNGDGANDFFSIKHIEYYPNTSLTVFDRWGRKVYENANYANEWKAEGLHDGTYFYVLDVPSDKKYNGFVQVVR